MTDTKDSQDGIIEERKYSIMGKMTHALLNKAFLPSPQEMKAALK